MVSVAEQVSDNFSFLHADSADEQLCVKREMRTQLGGIEYDPNFELDLGQRPDDIEMGQASK